MLVILMILFTICTVSPMVLKLYVLFAGKFKNFNILETSIYMFRLCILTPPVVLCSGRLNMKFNFIGCRWQVVVRPTS